MDDRVSAVKRLTDNYLAEMESELNQDAQPRKKTKAEKRAERREQKRLEAIADKCLIMRDELRRELELGARMQKRGDAEWHEMCKEIKIVEMQQEVKDWGEKAQRNVERKNDHIKMLLKDMDLTQEMHTRAYGKTVELIDHVRECFLAMVDGLKTWYEEQAEMMLRDYYDEVKRRTDEVEFMHQNSENIIHTSNLMVRDTLREDFDIFLEKRDDRVNTEIENRFRIRDQIVQKMMDMQLQLNEFIDALRNTELDAHKYERIRWLTERQKAFFEESARLTAEEHKNLALIKDMEREMVEIETEHSAQINDLRLEFEYFQSVRNRIEMKIERDRNITHEKLRILTGESFDLVKKFKKYEKTGELLLALSSTCRKLQTESEKVVLGGEIYDETELGDVDESFVLSTLDLKSHVDMTEAELVEQNKLLRNFWRRQAMAQTHNLLLLQDKHKLTAENEHYIKFVKTVTKTENVDELKSAVSILPCLLEKPQSEQTDCLSHRLRRKPPVAHPSSSLPAVKSVKDLKAQVKGAVSIGAGFFKND